MSKHFFEDGAKLIVIVIVIAAALVLGNYIKRTIDHGTAATIARPDVQEMARGIIEDRDRMRQELVELAGEISHYDSMGRDWREFVAAGIERGISEDKD